MAGKVTVNTIQLGDSTTATQNFAIQTNVDGTGKLSRGNVGATTQDIVTWDVNGRVKLTQTPGPAFAAYASTTTTLPSGIVSKIALITEEFDTNSCYDATNSRFTPTVPGYYFFKGQYGCVTTAINSTTVIRISIYKNGVIASSVDMLSSANIAVMPQITELIFLNGSTDYVELFAFQNTGATLTVYNGQVTSRFAGYLAREV